MYTLNTAYSLEKIENNLVAINSEKEKVIILGDIEQFLLENILKMSESEVVRLALNEYENDESIENDIHKFIQSLIKEEIILQKDDNIESD